jgi:hypothetical protein
VTEALSQPVPAGIGFVWRICPASRVRPPRCPKAPRFGFVSHISPLAPPVDCRNSLCSAELLCGPHPGRPRLGLFVQRTPAPPGKLALFVQRTAPGVPRCRPGQLALFYTSHFTPQTSNFLQLALFRTLAIGLEWWNNRIVDWWDIPALSAGPQPMRLALFVQTGISPHWLRPPNHQS